MSPAARSTWTAAPAAWRAWRFLRRRRPASKKGFAAWLTRFAKSSPLRLRYRRRRLSWRERNEVRKRRNGGEEGRVEVAGVRDERRSLGDVSRHEEHHRPIDTRHRDDMRRGGHLAADQDRFGRRERRCGRAHAWRRCLAGHPDRAG